MLDFPCHGPCRLLIIILVENLFHVSDAADVTLTCPETGFENGQVVDVTCVISGQKANSYDCPQVTSIKKSTDDLNERAVRFEFLNRHAVLSMTDSFTGWEGAHLLVNGSSCGPAVKWNNSVQCSQYDASGPVSTYTYKFTVDSTRHRGAGLRCVVGCTHNPRRHSDVTIAYDTCNPLKFTGTAMDDLDDYEYLDDDEDADDEDDDGDPDNPNNPNNDSKGISPGDNNETPGASKAGAVIGSIVGVIVVIGLVGFLISRRNRGAEKPGDQPSKAQDDAKKLDEQPKKAEEDAKKPGEQPKKAEDDVKKPGEQPKKAQDDVKKPDDSDEEGSKSGEQPGMSPEISSQESDSIE